MSLRFPLSRPNALVVALAAAPGWAPAVALALMLGAVPAAAERADRTRPMVVEADRPGTVGLQRQVVVFNGNVVITQGTMVLRAERVEMRETNDGYREASAIGMPGRPATWRQRRDGVDETVEGSAERIEFDGRADTLRFIGSGAVRRLRGASVADEITGATIVWDNVAEVFRVEGGESSETNPGGRVRVILSPRADGAPDAAATPAPATTPREGAPLQPSRRIGGPQ